MTSTDALVSTVSGPLVRVALNRPERKNALDRALVRSLGDALDAAVQRNETRVIVLEGRGGAFSSGADLGGLTSSLDDPDALVEDFHRLIRTVVGAPQPVIAAVDGPAVGFGADLALACDLRVLSSRAYLQDSFVRIGLMPDGGGTFWLQEMVGLGRALEFLLLGTRLDAARCLELGLANRVVEPAALETALGELTSALAEAAPLAVRAIKHAVRASAREGVTAALAREKAGQMMLIASDDFKEGVAAFMQKRPAKFTGR